MRFASLLSFLKKGGQYPQGERRHDGMSRDSRLTCRPKLEVLECRTLLSATLELAVMGDSLSAPYVGPRAAALDRSWVEQLQALRCDKVIIHNEAVAGATSSTVLAQVPAGVDLVAH